MPALSGCGPAGDDPGPTADVSPGAEFPESIPTSIPGTDGTSPGRNVLDLPDSHSDRGIDLPQIMATLESNTS